MDNEKETPKKSWITNICLRCEKEFTIKEWKLDDVRFKRLCNNCKTYNEKRCSEMGFIETAYH